MNALEASEMLKVAEEHNKIHMIDHETKIQSKQKKNKRMDFKWRYWRNTACQYT